MLTSISSSPFDDQVERSPQTLSLSPSIQGHMGVRLLASLASSQRLATLGGSIMLNSRASNQRPFRRVTVQTLITATLLCTSLALPISATAATPTSSDVLKLVSQASGITSLTATQLHGLDALTKDLPWRIYGATPGKLGCATLTSCTFGPMSAKKSLVILGDSHAMMWIPAIIPNAIKLGYKISLVWEPACPLASLSVPAIFPPDFRPNTCATWLSSTLAAVAHVAPQAIILGERSARVIAQGGTIPFSSAAWQAGLETTINALKGAHTKIALTFPPLAGHLT